MVGVEKKRVGFAVVREGSWWVEGYTYARHTPDFCQRSRASARARARLSWRHGVMTAFLSRCVAANIVIRWLVVWRGRTVLCTGGVKI